MFIAGFNMPGNLPESGSEEFETFEDARDYITYELEKAEEVALETDDNEETAEECYDSRNEAEDWKDDGRTKYWMVFCDGYVYWVERQ